VMCGGSILSCCSRNPHGHERALKEEEEYLKYYLKEVGYINIGTKINIGF